ncbi:hypothetical protein BDP27DRAFT_1430502 [Rhodocollybia butyracea]|uniref:HAT C-terminal dimerisation domain-containing protein n=1 Tax=Rhodocollybia butyracea TaxID=206335 RepID=A0A9P5PB33_9AGAR|nr:hypothetical protein BDP27DRAFT_1430502 [Rhodocollybia butyracea]
MDLGSNEENTEGSLVGDDIPLDDEVLKEDPQDRDDGDWQIIEDLSSTLTKVSALDEHDLVISQTTIHKTDEMCMMFHPKYKLTYFITQQWEPEWIETARTLICNEWNEVYKPTIDISFLQESDKTASTDDMDDLFKEINKFGHTNASTNAEDVLKSYLSSPTDAETDPVKFWVSRLDRTGDKGTPRGALARMGLDYLTALATSTHVEHLFSHGGGQVTERRHNLSFQSLRCLMVLHSWLQAGLVPEDEVLDYFRGLKTRHRGKTLAQEEDVYSDDEFF